VEEGERWGRAALIGTGYVGGSLALALTHAGRVATWVGSDPDREHLARARLLGIIGETAAGAAAAVRDAELVVIAAPVSASPGILRAVAPSLRPAALVIDVGATKQPVVAAAQEALPDPGRFVGCHPIAGREHSGPELADVNLFRGRPVVLTPTAETSPAAIEAAAALWRAVGARPVQMDPAHHDVVLAAASHLPHVAAYALLLTLAGLDAALGRELAGLAGAGLGDMTRVASSDPAAWRAILLDNRDAVLDMIEAFVERLEGLRRLVATGNGEELARQLGAARAARAGLLEQPEP
jgi:cyclohexadieny/prephenate dehydrogenase